MVISLFQSVRVFTYCMWEVEGLVLRCFLFSLFLLKHWKWSISLQDALWPCNPGRVRLICSSVGPHAAQGQSSGLITPLFQPSPLHGVSVPIHRYLPFFNPSLCIHLFSLTVYPLPSHPLVLLLWTSPMPFSLLPSTKSLSPVLPSSWAHHHPL